MSVEIHIFSDVRLNSTVEWQHAVDQGAQALNLSPDVNFADARGFFPAILNGEASGFECYHDDPKSMMEHYGANNFSKPWKYALGLRIGANLDELNAAWIAAEAYARATNGIILDGQTGGSYTPAQAAQVLSDMARDLPAAKAALKKIEAEFLAKRPP